MIYCDTKLEKVVVGQEEAMMVDSSDCGGAHTYQVMWAQKKTRARATERAVYCICMYGISGDSSVASVFIIYNIQYVPCYGLLDTYERYV